MRKEFVLEAKCDKNNNQFKYKLIYNFAFVTRYKRKIFTDSKIRKRAKEIIQEKCQIMDIKILKIVIKEEYIVIKIEAKPSYSPRYMIQATKRYCSANLLKEFTELHTIPNLFTKAFIVSTSSLSQNEISNFINQQKTRR